MNENRSTLFSNVSRGPRVCNFFFRSGDAERVHEERRLFGRRETESLRCDRCVTRAGETLRERERESGRAAAHSHLTRCDTARGSRGTDEPRANANLPDRPFSTDETERPTEPPLESRYQHHPWPHFTRAAAATSCHPPTLGRPLDVHPHLPLDLSQVWIDVGSCRPLYLHSLYQRSSLRPDIANVFIALFGT